MSVYCPERQNFATRPDDKRLAPRRRLSRELKDRWASIIEEDLNTDGLWEDVAKFFKVDRCDITPDEGGLPARFVASPSRP